MRPRVDDEDEDGWDTVRPVVGSTSASDHDEEDHEPHPPGFLYVPDLASLTGWANHRVGRMPKERPERRTLGFRR